MPPRQPTRNIGVLPKKEEREEQEEKATWARGLGFKRPIPDRMVPYELARAKGKRLSLFFPLRGPEEVLPLFERLPFGAGWVRAERVDPEWTGQAGTRVWRIGVPRAAV